MNHYLITIQYDGSAHRGWQRLANEPDTVQGILENALSAYFKESIRITGSGRTDAGVHALRQYADFFCRASLNIQDTQFLTDFNKTLPSDIRVTSIRPVSAGFHSRKSAVSKTYTYYTMLSGKPDVFFKNYAYCPADTPFRLKNADQPPLSYPEMRTAADALCGTHDFTSFTSDKTPGKSHVRRIDSVTVDTVTLPSGIELLRFTFCGNGFLYNMVRILSGTLLSVGLGQIPAAQIPAIIEGKSRPLAGPTLPPCGLFLTDVTYP